MINSDSKNALKIIKNPIFHIHIKYFDIYHHFIRDIIIKNKLSMKYISENENPIDIFMKSLDRNKHIIVLDLLRMA